MTLGLVLAAGLLTAVGAEDGPLMTNPGFEELEGPMPRGWRLFVQPMPGAYGRIEGNAAHDGRYCAALRNPEPYPQEPYNNWSQNIYENLGGKTLTVRGWIKTRDATEAAIWLQLFQRRPFRQLGFETSSRHTPLYGDTDWTPIEFSTLAPKGTDLLVLRCVLKGHGSAWFDSLEVNATPAETQQKQKHAAPEPPAEKPSVTANPEPDELETLGEGQATAQKVEPRVLRELQESNAELAAAARALREANETLMRDIQALRDEVRALQNELKRGNETPPIRRVPPIVPYGHPLGSHHD